MLVFRQQGLQEMCATLTGAIYDRYNGQSDFSGAVVWDEITA
jgi:hypothetical protein